MSMLVLFIVSAGIQITNIFHCPTGNLYIPAPLYKPLDSNERTSNELEGIELHTPANHLRSTLTLILLFKVISSKSSLAAKTAVAV